MKEQFEVENPDVVLSPFTGMTKPLDAEITLQDGTVRDIFCEEMDGKRRC